MLFLRKEQVLAAHARAIEEFGGLPGLRDEGLLDSALAAPIHRKHYEEADTATCAATYAFHLTQAHAFIDGNKRVAAAAAEAFVQINGLRLTATNEQIVALFLRIAAGNASREEVDTTFAQWVSTGG